MHERRPTIERARQVLAEHFGFSDLRDGQRRVVAGILEGCDTLVVLPTGGGKSLCYQLPALVLPGLAVVVSPLIALMDDQVQALRRRRIAASALHSGLAPADEQAVWQGVDDGTLKLLYLSPERLLADRTLGRLNGRRIALLAIDEAHCVCEWGYDFRPSYLRLASARRRLQPRVTVALTATATPATRMDIIRVLELVRPLVVVSGFDRPNLHFAAEPASGMRERYARIQSLVRQTAPAACIVYAGTRSGVEAVRRYIARSTPAVDCYHAGRSATDRASVQQRFLDGSLRVLVATNAFGMGVDKPDVRLVVHLSPPGSIEDYYQEAGRASRDGAPGTCIVLASESDRHLHERFLSSAYPPESLMRARWSQLLRAAGGTGRVSVPRAAASRPGDQSLTSDVGDPVLMALARYGLVEVAPPPIGDWRGRLLLNVGRLDAVRRDLSDEAWQVLQGIAACRGATDPLGVSLRNTVPSLASREARRAIDELSARRMIFLVPPPIEVRLLWDRERDLPIDWRVHRARVAGERARLDAMHEYVRTQRCRRSFILRYFGQHHTQVACGDCDNCTQAGQGTHGRQSVFLGSTLRRARDGARVRAR